MEFEKNLINGRAKSVVEMFADDLGDRAVDGFLNDGSEFFDDVGFKLCQIFDSESGATLDGIASGCGVKLDLLDLALELTGECGELSFGFGLEFLHGGLNLSDADVDFFAMLIDGRDDMGGAKGARGRTGGRSVGIGRAEV